MAAPAAPLVGGLADPDALGSSQDWAIGYSVSLTTTLGEEVQGEVFAFDRATNCVVLRQPGPSPATSNLRLLKGNFIKAITSSYPPKQPHDLRLPYIDPQHIREREERALQAAEGDAAKVGVGVSQEAQALYDALSKTMPCAWRDRDIVVLSQVVITEPYLPENCKRLHEQDQAAEDRVRKMVLAARSRASLS